MTNCARCVLPTSIPSVKLDSKGECNFCKLHDRWIARYSGEKARNELEYLIEAIKHSRYDSRYDCVVGISGGCDSSYLLWKAREFGLKPLAVHFNNNWNTEIAEANMKKLTQGLGVDFLEVKVDRQEYDDICRSFLLASVPDADIPNDIALQTVMFLAAEKASVKYVLSGHNFRTEGTTPLEWSYMDGLYVADVQRRFGTMPLKTFENLWLGRMLKWMIIKRIKQPRLLWYLDYDKEEAKQQLHDKFGWQWYGQAHCENKYTEFVSNYLQPRKFGIDLRLVLLSARIRSGYLTRDEALDIVGKQPDATDLFMEVRDRLGFTSDTWHEMMSRPIKTHYDYKTYHATFRRYKWLFRLAANLNLIPKTFYEKYTR